MSPARHKLRTLTRSQILVLAGVAAAMLFLVGSVLWAQFGQQQAVDDKGAAEQQAAQAGEQRDATAAQAQQAVDPVLELCAQGDAVAQALRARGACELAAQVAATPVPTQPPLPGPTGAAGRPPTAAEISAAVDAYLVAHPPPAGRAPTAAEVAAAVASYLTANPPTPGRAPTAEEISAAVERYFADNPPQPGEPGQDGRDGRDGQDGRPPTAAEIRTAVDEYLAANPPPAGPKGDEGDPGEPPATFTMSLDGQTQTCTRSNADDSAPTYSCSAPAGPGENEPEGGTTTPPESEETP